jgi:hypothetical protein
MNCLAAQRIWGSSSVACVRVDAVCLELDFITKLYLNRAGGRHPEFIHSLIPNLGIPVYAYSKPVLTNGGWNESTNYQAARGL